MNTFAFQQTANRYPTIRKATLIRLVFAACCFAIIAGVSALDIWFAVENPSILHVEKNPVCAMLLEMDPQHCGWFVAGKATGTVLCLGLIAFMLRMKYRHANKVLVAVALFQMGLLVYLVLSDPLIGGLPNPRLLFSDTPESIWILKQR